MMRDPCDREYATVVDDDGVNYREIAEIMTEMGFTMNHSSARNHVLRVMKKFVAELTDRWNIDMSDDRMLEVAKSPEFQATIADMLHVLEVHRH